MRHLINKILNEEFDNFDWIPNPIKVIVTHSGSWYPTNVDAMVALGVTGAKEFVEKYGRFWWDSKDYKKWRKEENRRGWMDEDFFTEVAGLNVMEPRNGDICYLVDKQYIQGVNKIYKLIHIETGKEFIISEEGFKQIDD